MFSFEHVFRVPMFKIILHVFDVCISLLDQQANLHSDTLSDLAPLP